MSFKYQQWRRQPWLLIRSLTGHYCHVSDHGRWATRASQRVSQHENEVRGVIPGGKKIEILHSILCILTHFEFDRILKKTHFVVFLYANTVCLDCLPPCHVKLSLLSQTIFFLNFFTYNFLFDSTRYYNNHMHIMCKAET